MTSDLGSKKYKSKANISVVSVDTTLLDADNDSNEIQPMQQIMNEIKTESQPQPNEPEISSNDQPILAPINEKN